MEPSISLSIETHYSHYEPDESLPYLGPFACGRGWIAFQPNDNLLDMHWAVDSAQELLDGLRRVLSAIHPHGYELRIPFTPPELETDLLTAGFQIDAEYVEGWITDLPAHSLPPNRHLEVRLYEAADMVPAVQISRACYLQTRGFRGETLNSLQDWLSDPQHNLLIARSGGVPVGMAMIGLYGFNRPQDPVCWIRELAVHPDHQGKGIGREILLTALAWGKAQNAQRSFLMVDRDNQSGLHLYRSMGYQIDPDHRDQVDLIAQVHIAGTDVQFGSPVG